MNSDDDSMHEKYFKSVESTPQASRRRNTAGQPSSGAAVGHTKRSSDSSSPQSPPQGGGAAAIHQPVKVSSRSGSGGRSAGSGLDTTTSTNRSSRSNPSRDPLVEKPEKYLDKMLLQQHREKGNNTNTNSNSLIHPQQQQHQMKLPLNVESQFVSKTATITSQTNNNSNSMGTGTRSNTNSRISPKCVTPSGSQELMLSKTNLDRHNRDLAQCENQLKLKKRSPGNTGASNSNVGSAVVVVTPKAAGKGKQAKTNTYASDVDYDAGNMSPLYSNWDQQEHLLPLQHYIIEQAKLSKYSKYFGAGGGGTGAGAGGPPLPGDVDSVDSDSLHSDSQSEHDSFSGHEPDNEDSDHSEGRGDYLTYQHYMSEDVGGGDADRQNYYNVFDKNNGRGEDL